MFFKKLNLSSREDGSCIVTLKISREDTPIGIYNEASYVVYGEHIKYHRINHPIRKILLNCKLYDVTEEKQYNCLQFERKCNKT